MKTNRILLIEKLVVAIPDDLKAKDGRDEISLAEIFDYLAQFYRTADCAMHNQHGNYKYFFSNLPEGMIPSDLTSMDPNKLLQYMLEDPTCQIAGTMASLILDEEIGGYYRNSYTEREMQVFQERKKNLLTVQQQAHHEEEAAPCGGCDNICDEICPNDPASADRLRDEGETDGE